MIFREDFLTPNEFSRPGAEMKQVQAIVVHYTGNPGQSAAGLRAYFEGLKDARKRMASSHYAVDWRETIYMVPKREVAWHGGSGQEWPKGYTDFAKEMFNDYPNYHTIGIETCHRDETGYFDPSTLHNLRGLCAILCHDLDLDPCEELIRHHDLTGKLCPKWFVDHEDAWERFRVSVKELMVVMGERGRRWLS